MKRQLNVPIPVQSLQSLPPQNPPLILHIMKHENGHERGYLLTRTSSENDGTAFETITSDSLKIDRRRQICTLVMSNAVVFRTYLSTNAREAKQNQFLIGELRMGVFPSQTIIFNDYITNVSSTFILQKF